MMSAGDIATLCTAAGGLLLGLIGAVNARKAQRKTDDKDSRLADMQISVSSIEGWKNLVASLQETVRQQGESMNQMRTDISNMFQAHQKCEDEKHVQGMKIVVLENDHTHLKTLCESLQKSLNEHSGNKVIEEAPVA